ncbi:hypothetical protein ACTA71_005015 [Dictyostelium dimigraforme]
MKFLATVFIVILGFINSINCQIFDYSIKLEPFYTSDCTGDQSGVGYVAKLDTCFTIDDQTSFNFRLQGNDSVSVGISQFIDCESDDEKLIGQTYTIGSCIPAIQLDSIHQYLEPFYHLVSLIKVDKVFNHLEIPTDSIAMVYRVGTCVSIPLLVEYYTNNTKLLYTTSGETNIYYCNDNNYPVYQSCSDSGCIGPFDDISICGTIPSFYNETTPNPPFTGFSGETSGGNTGVKTGTSGHFSGNTIGNTPKEILDGGKGSDAFITYSSGHSSGNTIGISPDDKELYDRNGGFKDESSSSSYDVDIYYLSTICV